MIPKVFHRIWVGSEEPEWLSGFGASWTDVNDGWSLIQWDDDKVQELFPLVNQDVYDRADDIAGERSGQLKADVLRYEILWRFGGVYVDADFECVKPVGSLIAPYDCFAAWETQNVWINQAILGSLPQHPFIGRLVSGLADSVQNNPGKRPADFSGPKYVTPVWREHGGAHIFDQELFYPYSYRDVKRVDVSRRHAGAYAIHHWANRRRERGLV
jgi:inositol phosphorylceramide mannosyltransferase catalytic subunit